MSVWDAARDLAPHLTTLRRDFHQHPELGFEEHWTSARIAQELKDLGLEPRTEVAKTGLLVRIPGQQSGPAVALRADMDGLPLQEKAAVEFPSQHEGRMHACGHDAHLAMLLGAARLLVEHQADLPRDVVLIFQPSEERLPGGAPAMIREGALQDVGEVFALHVISVLPTGLIATRPGPLMASPSDLEIRIGGVGGHAALPHLAVDPIVLSSQVVLALQTLISRRIDPLQSAVVTIAAIHGGTIHNVIPDEVKMLGTVRTLSDDLREEVRQMVEEVVRGVVEPAGGRADVTFRAGYPVLQNEPVATDWLRQQAVGLFGPDQVLVPCPPIMAGEDFSYFLREVPGAFAFLGCGGDPGGAAKQPMNHHPEFGVDERCLPIGASLLARLALAAPRGARA